MKKGVRAMLALFLLVSLLGACSRAPQEDPRTTKTLEATVLSLDGEQLTLTCADQKQYVFDISDCRIRTDKGELAPGAQVVLYYTGSLNEASPQQTGAILRSVYVTSGSAAPQILPGSPGIKPASGYTLPSRSSYGAALEQEGGSSLQTVWKGESAVFPLTIFTADSPIEEATVQVSDFTGSQGVLPGRGAVSSFVEETLAYVGNSTYAPKTELIKESFPDILNTQGAKTIPEASLQNVWVSVPVPADVQPGLYSGVIRVTSLSLAQPLEVAVSIQVLDLTLPTADSYQFDVELWQYPYRIAQYYHVEPFGAEHIEILKQHMAYYRGLGGHAITASIVEEPWNGQTYGQYPSMISWTKMKDGTFAFDFKDFDTWVTLCKEMGMGDKIICYSMIPWDNQIAYFDERTQSAKTAAPEPGTKEYNQIWSQFLQALIAHTEEKGWFDSIYIGIDERPNMELAFDLIESIKGKNGSSLRISAAMDHFNAEYFPIIDRIHSVSVGSEALKSAQNDYDKLIERRSTNPELETTVYTCTGHFPNSFTYSLPLESYWTLLYSGSTGATGYLRWALDAWVQDPLQDTSYQAFESGDCFLLYPDISGSATRQTKSSVRFEMMRKGLQDVNKLYWLSSQGPQWQEEADRLFATVQPTYPNLGGGVATPEGARQLVADMETFQRDMNQLFETYLQQRSQ